MLPACCVYCVTCLLIAVRLKCMMLVCSLFHCVIFHLRALCESHRTLSLHRLPIRTSKLLNHFHLDSLPGQLRTNLSTGSRGKVEYYKRRELQTYWVPGGDQEMDQPNERKRTEGTDGTDCHGEKQRSARHHTGELRLMADQCPYSLS